MRKRNWDGMLSAMVLVRLGQELGTDSTLARAVSALCELVVKLADVFPVDRF